MSVDKKFEERLDDDFEDESELDDEGDEALISKSEIKREAEQSHALGLKLLALRPEQLGQLLSQGALPEKLYDELMECKRLTSHGALRRQKQYLAKIIRQVELEPILTQLIYWENEAKVEQTKFHQLERWRDRLLSADENHAALGELMRHYPAVDRQHLRNLIRNAQKEFEQQRPPKSSRELFQYLRQLVG